MTDKDFGSNRQGDLPTEQAAPPGLAFYDTRPSDSTVSLEFIAKIIRRAMQDHAAPATVRSERAAREIADRLGVHLLTAAETDPMERICGQALRAAGVAFITDHEAASPARLDFYLPESDLHIEVKRFHSERVAEQLRRAENVILLQGAGAVQFFASLMTATEYSVGTERSGVNQEILEEKPE